MEKLNEKTWNLDKVAKFIVEEAKDLRERFFNPELPFFGSVMNTVMNNQVRNLIDVHPDLINRRSVDMSQASLKKPYFLNLGVFKQSSYRPETGEIKINIFGSYGALLFLTTIFRKNPSKVDPSKLNSVAYVRSLGLPENQIKRFIQEFSEERIISTVYHELTHYLDDTLHHEILPKMLKMDKEQAKRYSFLSPAMYRYLSEGELNSAIANIKSFKQKVTPARYNKMTLEDLASVIPSLTKVYSEFSRYPKLIKLWKKKILSRLSREGLLGANMANVGKFS